MFERRPRILAIDDIPANLATLGAVLEKDYELFVATSGSVGLRLSTEALPDLILLDVMMPGMDGFEVCRRLKANPATKEIPVIFVTAKNDVVDQKEGFLSGGVDYIIKPYDIEIVLARVQTHLRLRFTEISLRSSEHRLQSIFEHSPDPIFILDDGHYVDCNQAAIKMLGFTDKASILGRQPADLAPEQQSDGEYSRVKAASLLEAAAQSGSQHYEWLSRRVDGEEIIVEASLEVVVLDGRDVLLCTWRDITERKQDETRLKLAASVFSNAREGIMVTNAVGQIIEVNEMFTRVSGFSKEDIIGQTPRMLKSGRQSDAYYVAMWKALAEKGHWYGEIWNKRKNGDLYAAMLSIGTICDDHRKTKHYVGMFTDITALKEHEQKLERIAHYDALTNLPNRVLLADRMEQAMIRSQRHDTRVAVAYLDLDGFKAVNDSYGHDVGDKVLITVAQRMKAALREGDTLARLGGDEFVAVMVDLEPLSSYEPILERILQAASEPVFVQGISLIVSVSIGVTLYPQDGADADQLLRHADQAMYLAKQTGKNRYHLFDIEQDMAVRNHRELLERIQMAFSQDEFVLHYQPKVNMKTGAVVGAEALIRWQHPDRGLLYPAEFLPLIEGHSLIQKLGEWTLNEALLQLAQWKKHGLEIPVSVNIAAHHLQQENFAAHMRELLIKHSEVKPELLELEILETSALGDILHVSNVIIACRELGVRFALDDFGTGYSSLTYLKRLPVDVLKIDQSFVRDMLEDPEDLAIVEGVLGLAAAFRRTVIAEGVESTIHGELLLPLGCELAQGYGIARPMPAEQMISWIQGWKPEPNWVEWVDRPLNRDALPLIFAEVEHRAWVTTIKKCIHGECIAPPPLDEHRCRFGIWWDKQGEAQYAHLPNSQLIGMSHSQLHALGTRMLDLFHQGRQSEAEACIAELTGQSDALVKLLRELLRAQSKAISSTTS